MRQKNTLKREVVVVQLRQSLEKYLEENGINGDNYISHMGNSQHFHAYALLHTIKIFQSHQSQQESDYARLNQHIAGFLQSAKAECCFYENKNLVGILNSYLCITTVPTVKSEYSPLLSMRISNDINLLRAHHLDQRNLWQKMKSFFVNGFHQAQERVDLEKFKTEYSDKADAVKTIAEFEDFEKRYTKPLEKRIRLLPIFDRRTKTKRDLEVLVADKRVAIQARLKTTETISGQLNVFTLESLKMGGASSQVVFTQELAGSLVAPMKGTINSEIDCNTQVDDTCRVTSCSYPDSFWLFSFFRRKPDVDVNTMAMQEQQSPQAALPSLSASEE